MSSIFAFPARRGLISSGRSAFASTSAYTLSGWVGKNTRQMSSTLANSATEKPNAVVTDEAVPASATAAATPVGTPRATTHYRITLRRSAIGLPSRVERIVKALGLKKRLSTVYHPHSASIAGSILSLKELVHVDNVRRLDPPVGRFANETQRDLAIRQWHAVIPDHEAVWVDSNGDVVDWGREAKRAPRGYSIVGNLISEKRDADIRSAAAADAAAAGEQQ